MLYVYFYFKLDNKFHEIDKMHFILLICIHTFRDICVDIVSIECLRNPHRNKMHVHARCKLALFHHQMRRYF